MARQRGLIGHYLFAVAVAGDIVDEGVGVGCSEIGVGVGYGVPDTGKVGAGVGTDADGPGVAQPADASDCLEGVGRIVGCGVGRIVGCGVGGIVGCGVFVCSGVGVGQITAGRPPVLVFPFRCAA